MEKKVFGAAMAVMMLVIVLSASIPVDAKAPLPITGLLIVKVFHNNQTTPDASVTAAKMYGNFSLSSGVFNIPYNNATHDYRRSLSLGLYHVDVHLYNMTQSQYAEITSNSTTTLYFWFP